MQKTVLVVDPDCAGLREITKLWHDQPWQTITTNTLEEAIDLLDEKVIDMIVTVEDLGWLSGYEFLRLTHHRYPRMVRILVTNDSSTSSLNSFSSCFHAEDHFHLVTSKPYYRDSMTEIVREMFGLEDHASFQSTGRSNYRF